MLHLYQSDRLEFLAEAAAALLEHLPPEHPFAAEEIIVQSQGMRRYLGQYLARRNGIAANLRFSLPAALSWRLTQHFLPGEPKLNPYAPEVLRWHILKHLENGTLPETVRNALTGYLNSHSLAPYHLSGKIADVFDQYLIYRTDWLDNWSAGRLIGLGETEHWQAQLWQLLDRENGGRHRGVQRRQMLDLLDRKRLAPRYLAFGISTLAPFHLELLHRLAEESEVHLFALNPSSGYWGDIDSIRQLARQTQPNPDTLGHPLLASLGRQGRDFFDWLHTDQRIGAQHNWFSAARDCANLLHTLQDDIRLLRPPAFGSNSMDGSIVIQSAHSPLRELQILKDWLLAATAANPELHPHQIAVLTPDIGRYAPYIHAVFGEDQAGSPRLPYSIADVPRHSGSDWIQLTARLLDIMTGRFENENLTALLDSPPICRHWGFTRQDADILRHQTAELNIRWGADEEMRRRFGGSGKAFTWQQGCERTILGWLLPEAESLPDRILPLWQDTAPYTADPALQNRQAAWFTLIGRLRHHHRHWQHPAPPETWCARIRALLDDIAGSDCGCPEEQNARETLQQLLTDWLEQTRLAGYLKPLDADTVCNHLSKQLQTDGDNGFLRGGITFCGMVPMRSLPFDTLCLLGLNDGRYPRRTPAADFDLIARHPRRGDRSRREDDRYLFLESIISARHTLYLSFIGSDPRKDEVLAPSPLLGELCDTLAHMCGQDSKTFAEQHIHRHPLQAFSPRYFTDPPRSSRSDYADALNRPPQIPAPFAEPAAEPSPPPATLHTDQLTAFWYNPVRHWLRHSLQWQEPYLPDAHDGSEPYTLDRSHSAAAAFLDARRRHLPFPDTQNLLAARNLLPAGLLGQLLGQNAADTVKRLDQHWFAAAALPDQSFQTEIGGTILSGSLTGLYPHGRTHYLSAPPHAPALISLWLDHLYYCAFATGSQSRDSHIVCPGQTETLPALDSSDARAQIAQWLAYYRLGQSTPLPFFPKTSLAAATAWTQDEDGIPDKARTAARQTYRGNKMQAGQNSRTEVELVFGRDTEEPVESTLFWTLVHDLLLPLTRARETGKQQQNNGE